MQHVLRSSVYSEVDDSDYLRAAIDALGGLVEEANSTAGITLMGLVEAAIQRRKSALDRLTQLIVDSSSRYPVVLDPLDRAAVASVQGQPLTPVVTTGTAATTGLSSAQVWMPPGHRSRAHVHRHTDVGVVVVHGRAVTLWWDERGQVRELEQGAGQHLHIPFGVVHAAVNPFDQPVVAIEWRANRTFNADNERIAERDPEVRARLRRFGVAA